MSWLQEHEIQHDGTTIMQRFETYENINKKTHHELFIHLQNAAVTISENFVNSLRHTRFETHSFKSGDCHG